MRAFLFGPSDTEQERSRSDQVNHAVHNVTQNVEGMEKKRDLLAVRANRLKKEAQDAQTQQQFALAESKAAEYADTMDQVDHLSNILENQRTTRNAVDQMSTNVNAFETQKDAANALEHVTSQIQAKDVDDVALRLETQLDQVDDVSRVLTKPIHRRQGGRRGAAESRNPRKDRAKDLLSQWDTATMPAAHTPTTAADVDNNNNIIIQEKTTKSEQKEDKVYK